MQVTDPKPYLEGLDMNFVRDILGRRACDNELVESSDPPSYSEPPGGNFGDDSGTENNGGHVATVSLSKVVQGKVLTLGDFIDTDAVITFPPFSFCRIMFLHFRH